MAWLLGLEGANPAPTPEVAADKDVEEEPLDEQQAKIYRRGVGVSIYVASDRPDVQHAVRELTKDMKSPKPSSMNRLRRLTRYLLGPRYPRERRVVAKGWRHGTPGSAQ